MFSIWTYVTFFPLVTELSPFSPEHCLHYKIKNNSINEILPVE